MKWYLKILSFIDKKTLLEILKTDMEFFKKISTRILIDCNEINSKQILISNIKSIRESNIITNLINLYPRITKFNFDDCSFYNDILFISNGPSVNGRYILNGEPCDDFIFSDKILPYRLNSNIPFSFLFRNYNMEYEFINSNIYYFEFQLDKFSFREEFNNENLQIGFISSILKKDEVSFGDLYSCGIDIKENCIKLNGFCYVIPTKIEKGDVIGLGIEYVSHYLYKIILTINGYLIDFENEQGFFKSNNSLKIGMNLRSSYGINVNFGDDPFVFNIKDLINCSNVINLCRSSYFNQGFDDSLINCRKIFLSKWKSPINVKKFFSNYKFKKPLIYKNI